MTAENKSKRCRFAACALVLTIGPLVALADARAGDKAAEKAAADALFRGGREAVGRGDFATACPKFEESMRLDPAAGTLFNLVQCDEHAGDLLGALAKIERLSAMLTPGDDRGPLVLEQAARMERRLAHVTVSLEPGSPEGTGVLIDGTPVPLEHAVRANPGKHTLVVRAAERRERAQAIDLRDGETREVVVAPTPLDPGVSAVPPPPAARLPPAGAPVDGIASGRAASPSTARVAGWITLGTGITVLVAGSAAGLLAIRQKGEALDHCSAAHVCDEQGLASAERFRTLSLMSTLGIVLGAAGIGAGTLLVVTSKESPRQFASFRPLVFAGGGGFGASGSF